MANRKAESSSIWRRLVGVGEEKLGQLAEEILANPHITEALSTALRRAAKTKGQVDRNMQLVLGALNLPSRADFNRLVSKVEALQGSLVNLNIKIDRLMAARAEPRKRSPGSRSSSAAQADSESASKA